jgi:hypothetical protein
MSFHNQLYSKALWKTVAGVENPDAIVLADSNLLPIVGED